MTRPLVLEARRLHYDVGLPNGDRLQILRDCSVSLRAGESLAIVGRSGSGKSTLLSVLGLLASASAGDVLIDGTSVRHLRDGARTRLRRRHLGFVFQNFALLSHLSVLANVMLPVAASRRNERRQARVRALELLDAVGLAHRAAGRPPQLSGGEQQRVAIARALVNSPQVVLADEPTGSLDEETAQRILGLLTQEAGSRGVALIVVTHDDTVARQLDSVATLQAGRLETVADA